MFVTGKQVRELQRDVQALTEEQRRTNALLSELLDQYGSAVEHQRTSADHATRFNSHLSTTALSVAMVGFVVGLMSVFAALPASLVTYVGISTAGLVVVMFLGVAIRQVFVGWRLRQHLDQGDTDAAVPDLAPPSDEPAARQ